MPAPFITTTTVVGGRGHGLITRGLGNSGLLVTIGYGGHKQQIIELAQKLARAAGRSATRRRDETTEIIISARLLAVNGIEPDRPIKGRVSVTLAEGKTPRVKIVESSVQPVRSEIVIRVRRITRSGKGK